MNQPLVSVVTPFRNTAPYLAECIESVLAQSYSRFEYVLSDNGSTDGSLEIAERYAQRDARIRLIRQPTPLPQAAHYNNVLTQICHDSKYCKLVQADDWIFPEYLRSMVDCFEQSDSIGLVSSYYLKGDAVRGSGYPYPKPLLSGKEMGRMFLRTGLFVFGSETTVMYRSSFVRDSQPFFGETLLHIDTEKCMQILEHWDFGFVHQVLSFIRTDNINASISAGTSTFQPDILDRYIVVRRFAAAFLEETEAASLKKEVRREYYTMLGNEAVRLRPSAFWRYHQRGLATLGDEISWPQVAYRSALRLLSMAVNPGTTIASVMRRTGNENATRFGVSETKEHSIVNLSLKRSTHDPE